MGVRIIVILLFVGELLLASFLRLGVDLSHDISAVFYPISQVGVCGVYRIDTTATFLDLDGERELKVVAFRGLITENLKVLKLWFDGYSIGFVSSRL